MPSLPRRALLRTAALLPLTARCARQISSDPSISTGPPLDGNLRVALADAPALARAGGAVVVHPAGAPSVLLVNSGTGYLALAARCPHAGCELAWVPEDREAECPCHGSRFAGDGTLLNPPATVNLGTFPVSPPDAQGVLVVHLFAGDGTFREGVQNGVVSFPITEFPALATVGGAIQGRPDGFPGPLLVTRIAASGPDAVAALSAVCTHLGCTVLPQACATCASGTILQCPCHGSQFGLTGNLVSGPASGNLIRYVSSFDGTNVTVSTQPRGA